MKALTLQKKSIIIAVCTFVMAMTGLFVFDGTTNESFALTTPDCRVCHTGGDWPTVIARHHNVLNRGCASCHRTGTPRLTPPGGPIPDPDHPDRDCLTCHYPGSASYIYNAIDVTTAHTPLHDMTDVPDPVTCTISCHFPGVIDEHTKYPSFAAPSGEMDCDRCHKNTNTDETLGPINVQEQIALGSSTAVSPQVITCEKCHTTIGSTGHAEAHDNVLPNTGCNAVGCHNSNVMLEHTDRGWPCDTCHGNTTAIPDTGASLSPQQVIDASAGPYDPASTKFCTDCHGTDAGNHAALHDQVFFLMSSSQQNCTRCHESTDIIDPLLPIPAQTAADVVAEHITNQGLTCSTCHDGFDYSITDPTTGDPVYYVINTIEKGRTSPASPGEPVYCIDCHRNDTLGQGTGHNPISTDAEPWNACRQCHYIFNADTELHTSHLGFALEAGYDCAVCHVPTGTRPDCVACHQLDPRPAGWVMPYPVERTQPNDSLNILGPGTEDHDKHTEKVECITCHPSGVPGSDPLPVPYSECSNCHYPNSPYTGADDISYGSYVHTFNHIQGVQDQFNQSCSFCHSNTPGCTQCHEIAGPNMPQHDTHAVTLEYDCNQCHVDGVPGSEPLPYPFNECSVCHNPDGNPDGIMGSDITYGSLIHTESHIAGGKSYIPDGATSPLSCDLCHDPANPPTCAECHSPGHPPVPAPFNGCSACHNGVPTEQTFNLTLGNIMYGELGHNVHMLQADDQGYTCSICHVPQGTSPTCAECHIPEHPSIPAPYNTCDQCHDTLNPGQATHIAHKAEATDAQGVVDCAKCHVPSGSIPNCGECHTGDANHETAHVNVGVPSPGCTTCHSADIVEEHLTNRPEKGYTCATCHDQQVVDLDPTVVYDAIHNNNGSVTCSDCHVGQNSHHETDNAKTGDCAYCHADPRLAVDANAPSGQLACRQCHIDNNSGFVKTSADKPSHAINTNGNIQDFGACFACHQPTPYHAKPTSWPGWYEENQQATGRGSFNLFFNEFQPNCASRGDCEGTSYEDRNGYGEDSQPARDRGRNWSSPSISYTMVTFYDHFNTKREWTVPTFGTGGGSPGGGGENDSVNITYASYSSRRDRLTVYAENDMGHDNVSLTVKYNGNSYEMNWDSSDNRWERTISTSRCSDSTIEVESSAGGTDSSSVSNCSSW